MNFHDSDPLRNAQLLTSTISYINFLQVISSHSCLLIQSNIRSTLRDSVRRDSGRYDTRRLDRPSWISFHGFSRQLSLKSHPQLLPSVMNPTMVTISFGESWNSFFHQCDTTTPTCLPFVKLTYCTFNYKPRRTTTSTHAPPPPYSCAPLPIPNTPTSSRCSKLRSAPSATQTMMAIFPTTCTLAASQLLSSPMLRPVCKISRHPTLTRLLEWVPTGIRLLVRFMIGMQTK